MLPEPIESETVEDAASSPAVVESPAAQHLRLILVQDQMKAAAEKVNLLFDMGLTKTAGYTEAYALYHARLADFNELRARLGL